MSVDHVLAVIPVADFEASHAGYERLFGRPADNQPMDGLVEWRLTDGGWVQVTRDFDRAGSALLNLAVHDVRGPAPQRSLGSGGLVPGEIQTVTKGVQLSAIRDPDGNLITFIAIRDLIVTEIITLDVVIEAADALLLGRVTFEQMRGYWPLQTDRYRGWLPASPFAPASCSCASAALDGVLASRR